LPIHDWRWLFYIAIIPVILALVMQRFVPEPQAWINDQTERAQQKLAGPRIGSVVKHESMYKQIFSDPQASRMFIRWALTASFMQLGYCAVNNWMPTYLDSELSINLKSMTGYMVGTYTAILGKMLAGMDADRIGRRTVFVFGALGTAVFLPVIVLFQSQENTLWMLVVFGFLYGIPYGVNATYMTESFEAKIRGSAVGGAYNIGRLGAAVAPAAIGFLTSHGSISVGFLVMGAAYFICGVIPALSTRDKQFGPQKQ
jgi:AAHS family cis,cis-muconate transporter-like MFS transporter